MDKTGPVLRQTGPCKKIHDVYKGLKRAADPINDLVPRSGHGAKQYSIAFQSDRLGLTPTSPVSYPRL